MFCVVPCLDVDVLKKISAECGWEYRQDCLLNSVLIVDETVVGVSQMSLRGRTARLVFAGVKPDFRGKGYGDLVMRSAFNKVMDGVDAVEVESTHPYFKKFGFNEEGGIMRAESKDIVFPSYCKHNEKD